MVPGAIPQQVTIPITQVLREAVRLNHLWGWGPGSWAIAILLRALIVGRALISTIVAADEAFVALTDDPSLAAPVERSLCQVHTRIYQAENDRT